MTAEEFCGRILFFFFHNSSYVIVISKMIADKFLYVFFCVKYLVMDSYVGQFACRTVTL